MVELEELMKILRLQGNPRQPQDQGGRIMDHAAMAPPPRTFARHQGRKLLSCVIVQLCVKELTWLLIGYQKVKTNQEPGQPIYLTL